MAQLVIARNPDPDSSLGYLLWLPLGDGLLFRTSGTWPRTTALYCHPVELDDWPEDAELEVVERVALRSCARRGAAIDVVADRGREHRSQIVYTRARGRAMVFWQSPRTRKQARPQVRTPTARAGGLATDTDRDGGLEVLVDSHEQYPYRFARQQVTTSRRALPAGDYGVVVGGMLVAAVERKSLPDLVASLTSGRLRYAMGELATLGRAAVVIEDRYSQIFKQDRVRPALVADGLAELAVRWPGVPVIFAETRPLAEEWTYRYLATAAGWARDEHALGAPVPGIALAPATSRSAVTESSGEVAPGEGGSAAEVRAWARTQGLAVADRGRISAEIVQRYRAAHLPTGPP